MSALHVLLPPLAHFSEASAFVRWLARGNRLPVVQPARDAAVRRLFRFAGESIPVAALRHHAHADDAEVGAWLAADPAFVRSEATGARLLAWPVRDLTAVEAGDLASVLRPMFGDAGAPVAVDTPSAWCLHLPAGTPPAHFVPPTDAMGVDLLACLPRGDAARSWRRLFNEAQVLLHAHPVNALRVAAGKLPVNALWLWGVGALPGAAATSLALVASDDDVLRGLARLTGTSACPPSRIGAHGVDGTGDVLLDLDNPDPVGVPWPWLPHFRRWLRERRFDVIALTFANGDAFEVRHAHRLRFWRRG